MSDILSKPTAGALRAFGLAQIVNKVFATDHVASTVPGHPGYRVEMSAPEGLSTSERKNAIDQLHLVPAGPTDTTPGRGAPILIGKADPNLSQLELRTYDRLKAQHAQDFDGAALPFDAAAYDVIRVKIEQFFDRQGIGTVLLESHGVFSSPPRTAGSGGGIGKLVVGAVAIVVVAVVVFFVLRK